MLRNIIRSVILLFTALGLLYMAAPASPAPIEDHLVIDGGMDAVGKLLGHVDTRPENFVLSVNRILLDRIQGDHEWKDHPERVVLAEYIKTVQEIKSRFGQTIELSAKDHASRKRFSQLANIFGYQVKHSKSKGFELSARDSARANLMKRVEDALSWDLVGTSVELSAGEERTLQLMEEEAPSPLSFGKWQVITGRQIDQGSALLELVKDQRLGLVLEGFRHLTTETADLFQSLFFDTFYKKAHFLIYRYGPSLEVRDGTLVLPGGPDAATAWTALIGEDPAQLELFIPALVKKRNGGAIYLWHALFFAPPDVAGFYLGHWDAADRRGSRFLRKFLRRLDALEDVVHFGNARGRGIGFATFVRSVRTTPDQQGLDFPGGPSLWYRAVCGDQAPDDLRGLQRLVEKAKKRQLTQDEFIFKMLTETVTVAGIERPALPRLIMLAGFYAGRPSLCTPENLIMLGRAADQYPMALKCVDRMEVETSALISRYLLTVSHLARLRPDAKTDLLTANFQGGIQLVLSLTKAGHLEPKVLEEFLDRWLAIHQVAKHPDDASPNQLKWLVDLLLQLPPAEDIAPGRGPYERALISASIPCRDPQQFEWRDLQYEGRRGDDLAQAFEARLITQNVAVADQLVEIRKGLDQIHQLCKTEHVEKIRECSAKLIEIFEELPGPSFDPPIKNNELAARIMPQDRPENLDLLRKINRIASAKKIPSVEKWVMKIEEQMAHELRLFLLAPAYMEAMGEAENILFEDPNLIHKHTMTKELTEIMKVDTPWVNTRVTRSEEPGFGSHITGHLTGVTRAIVDYHLAGLALGQEIPVYDPIWFENAIKSPWYEIDTVSSSVVSALIELGEILIRQVAGARKDEVKRVTDILLSIIPAARFERELTRLQKDPESPSLISISEKLMIGLSVFEAGIESDKHLGIAPDAINGLISQYDFENGDIRSRLTAIGSPTPNINGIGRPWLGFWPPYEVLENEGSLLQLRERQLVDLRLAIVTYLGRHQLPGEVGADLMHRLLLRAARELRLETAKDWEGFIEWLGGQTNTHFDGMMRECFASGLYSAQWQ